MVLPLPLLPLAGGIIRSNPTGPLAGITVVDMSVVIAGTPYAHGEHVREGTHLLSHSSVVHQ